MSTHYSTSRGNNVSLSQALEYHNRGWCVVPMRADGKYPAPRWKEYQAQRPTEQKIQEWFQHGRPGIGVLPGNVSGGLACRDFDDLGAYESWRTAQPKLALELPTVQTSRGRHVYFRADSDALQVVRQSIGRPDGTGAIACGDGELRAGPGSFCALPPSRHPSGGKYRWIVHPAKYLKLLDPVESGLLVLRHPPVGKLYTETQRHKILRDSGHNTASGAVELAIERCLPASEGERNRCLFELARSLKALPDLSEAPAEALESYVREWHQRALPCIGSKLWFETWEDFRRGWQEVKYPKGTEPMSQLFSQAMQFDLPACALRYEDPEVQWLIALCRELQRVAGKRPFFLSCRKAGELLRLSHTTADTLLNGLLRDDILSLAREGELKGRRAREWWYLGDL